MLHDYLHCLVFKEQSCLALLSKCLSLQATHLSYRIQISLSRTFLISFFKFFEPSQRLASQGFATLFCVRICQRLVLYYTSSPYMSTPFLKKSKKTAKKVQFVLKIYCSYVVRGELDYRHELVAPVTRTSMCLLLITAKMTVCTDIT